MLQGRGRLERAIDQFLPAAPFGVEVLASPRVKSRLGVDASGKPMKPTISKTGPAIAKSKSKDSRGATFAPPSPKVTRQKRAKVLTAAERAAFLASRPDLKPTE